MKLQKVKKEKAKKEKRKGGMVENKKKDIKQGQKSGQSSVQNFLKDIVKKVNVHSIRFQILGLCLISILIVVSAISILILPRIGRVVKNSITVHMNDFVTEHSKQIDNYTSNTEQIVHNIQQTCASATGVVNAMDIYKQVSRQLKVYDTQNQLGDNYAVVVDENREVVAATKDEYMGQIIDEDTYHNALSSEDLTKMTAVTDETTGKVNLILSKQVTLSDGTVAMLYYYTSTTEIQRMLVDYTLNDIPDSKVYLVDQTGMIIAHSDEKQVGKKTDNQVILDFYKKIEKGGKIATQATYGKYTSKGQSIGVSYIYLPKEQWVMVVTALDKQVYSGVNGIRLAFVFSCIASIVIATVLITLITKNFTKPIEAMNRVIRRIAELDYTSNLEEKRKRKVEQRKDEIGEIARSIDKMIGQVTAKLNVVTDSSIQMNQSAVDLREIINQISEKAADTSAITQQISAGMEETTASTEVITHDVDALKDHINHIKTQIGESTEYANQMMQHSEKMIQDNMRTEEKTKQLFEDIKQKGIKATKQAEAVKQIDEFARVIQSIASQTSLLSLNASIEAARAGDAGRGFSVVAQEIGSLANQSSDTVKKITDMVKEVNQAVANILECLNTSQDFVENNVYLDYENMQKILKDYGSEMQKIHFNMSQVDEGATSVNEKVGNIAESIQAINQTVQESAIGIADIASRNSEIGELTSDSSQMVNDTESLSKALKESMEEFKL